MEKDLVGTVAVITGGASGIGRDIAFGLAKAHAVIIICDIDGNAAKDCAAQLQAQGTQARAYTLDITKRKAVYQCAEKIYSAFGRVDILVNNAGVVTGKNFLKSTDEENILTMNVNTLSHFWTAKAFLPGMIRQKSGHLVTISSAAGLTGVAGLADYCASKFAVFGFHESIRAELKKEGLRKIYTTVICPYYIDTGMFAGVGKSRFSFLLPILDQKTASERIIKAILKKRQRLCMPRVVYTIPFLRIFPVTLFDAVSRLLGVQSTMDTYTGRKPGKKRKR